MSEAEAIERSAERGPATVATLIEDLRTLGVADGDVLIVHTSLSRLGWVVGGPIAVIDALRAAVGEAGTLVMPTHSPVYTDPSGWTNPPVPKAWWPVIREGFPAFDPQRTPAQGMGVVAEAFRTLPGVLRSNHPVGSFAAQGLQAAEITAEHPLDDLFGERSPLGRLDGLGATILLLGVGHDNNTSLHLAEVRSGTGWRDQGSPILRDGRRVWETYRERWHDSDDFPGLAAAYAARGGTVRAGRVAAGEGTLVPMRDLVDFGAGWLVDRRTSSV